MNKFKIVVSTVIIISLIQTLAVINYKESIVNLLQSNKQPIVFNDTGSIKLGADYIPTSLSEENKNDLFLLTFEINDDSIVYSLQFNGKKECSINIPSLEYKNTYFVTFKPKEQKTIFVINSKPKNQLKLIKVTPSICFKNDLDNIEIITLKPIIIPQ